MMNFESSKSLPKKGSRELLAAVTDFFRSLQMSPTKLVRSDVIRTAWAAASFLLSNVKVIELGSSCRGLVLRQQQQHHGNNGRRFFVRRPITHSLSLSLSRSCLALPHGKKADNPLFASTLDVLFSFLLLLLQQQQQQPQCCCCCCWCAVYLKEHHRGITRQQQLVPCGWKKKKKMRCYFSCCG